MEPAWNNGADGDSVLRHIPAVDLEEVISTLKDHEAALRAREVVHAALFGSVARGDQRADSDIDIMVEIEPSAGIDLSAWLDILHFIEDLFTIPLDVANRRRLKPFVRSFVRPGAERDAIHAF